MAGPCLHPPCFSSSDSDVKQPGYNRLLLPLPGKNHLKDEHLSALAGVVLRQTIWRLPPYGSLSSEQGG
ncbi:hypothetical protein E2320_000936 [Naja naja]|nr:hypothetical protein E2320_000936 [Naja naja]